MKALPKFTIPKAEEDALVELNKAFWSKNFSRDDTARKIKAFKRKHPSSLPVR